MKDMSSDSKYYSSLVMNTIHMVEHAYHWLFTEWVGVPDVPLNRTVHQDWHLPNEPDDKPFSHFCQ